MDILEAQNCCCYFSLPAGLALIGFWDIFRLAVHLYSSIEVRYSTPEPAASGAADHACARRGSRLRCTWVRRPM